MLELFKVRNFMSFREESYLDMRATILKQHPKHIIETKESFSDAKNGLLKTVAIYGANASGKSNLISALYSMRMFILSQIYDNSHTDNDPFKLEPFSLCSKNGTTEFEIVFRFKGRRYQYGFEIMIPDSDDEKATQKIVSEWYYIDENKVFERNYNDVKFGTQYESALKDYKKIPSERIYISVLDYFLDDSKKGIVSDLITYLRKHFYVFSVPIIDFPVKRMGAFSSISRRLIEDEKYRERVVSYLRQIDAGINDLVVIDDNDFNSENGEIEEHKVIKSVHAMFTDDGNLDGSTELGLFKESSGTLRFLAYIQRIIEIQESGGIFIVDELSDNLHPLLTKFIIDIFQSEENQSAQLVFSTHDVFQLTKEQFRRDEVVFVDKNEKGESTTFSLAQLKVREDSTFNKDYISGKYGAIPIFRAALEDKE